MSLTAFIQSAGPHSDAVRGLTAAALRAADAMTSARAAVVPEALMSVSRLDANVGLSRADFIAGAIYQSIFTSPESTVGFSRADLIAGEIYRRIFTALDAGLPGYGFDPSTTDFYRSLFTIRRHALTGIGGA